MQIIETPQKFQHKGHQRVCANYEGTILLYTAYKFFATMNPKLKYAAKNVIELYQCKFAHEKSKTDVKYVMAQAVEYSIRL